MNLLISYSILFTILLHIYGLYKFTSYCIRPIQEHFKRVEALKKLSRANNKGYQVEKETLNQKEFEDYVHKNKLNIKLGDNQFVTSPSEPFLFCKLNRSLL